MKFVSSGRLHCLVVLKFWVLLSQYLFTIYTSPFERSHTFIEQNFNKCTVYAIVSPLSTIHSFATILISLHSFSGLAVKPELSQWSHIIDFSTNNRRKEILIERVREVKKFVISTDTHCLHTIANSLFTVFIFWRLEYIDSLLYSIILPVNRIPLR